jgi:3-hydroxyisobutyrate dehydrogenase
LGARVVPSVQEAVDHAQCLILMLANAQAIEQVLFKSNISLRGKTVIQMGTISPTESRDFAQKIQRQKGSYLECPVLGSIQEVKDGKLILMVGSSKKQFSEWQNLLKCFGPQPKYIGTVGQAAALKLALNQLIASLISSFAFSLAFVQSSRVNVDSFMEILRQSVLYAPTFDKKLPRMLKHNYKNPNFSTKHMLKDVKLFLKESQRLRIKVPAVRGVRQLLEATIKNDLMNVDYCSLYETVKGSRKGRKLP